MRASVISSAAVPASQGILAEGVRGRMRSMGSGETMGRKASFGFTKLIVNDLDACAAYYGEVFGFTETMRLQAHEGDRAISEIIMGPEDGGPNETLVMYKYVNRPTPPTGEVILGFTTDDLDALIKRSLGAGGAIAIDLVDMPEHGVKVVFLSDPEGHLSEVVQVMKR